MRLTYLENRRNVFNTLWTAELIERLTALWADGYSASQIADKLSGRITRCAVIGKVHRLNLPARKPRQPAQRKPYTRRASGIPKPPAPPPRPQPPPPPQPTPSPLAVPHMRELDLFQLKPRYCRWPLGGFLEVARLFCAADTEGEVYCPVHQRIARVKEKNRG
jgi:GcrA cell cycle regulator